VVDQQQMNAAEVVNHNPELTDQILVCQQRINAAEVAYLDLEPIESILQENKDVKDYFPDDSGFTFTTMRE
jgi:hypothetical protein